MGLAAVRVAIPSRLGRLWICDKSMTEVKGWIKENSTIIYFLIAQFIAIGGASAAFFAYMVKLETRVFIMETRGAAYTVSRMDDMKLAIAKLQQSIDKNEDRIERIVTIMTKELHIAPERK
jgi:exopolysaccharide biosynthesis protein